MSESSIAPVLDSATTAPWLSTMVMAFNEVRNLAPVSREIHAELTALGRPFELIIVDDGSSDGTSELADSLARELSCVRVIHHGVNRGLGGVYRTGFSQARGEYITFFPADGQFPAEIITRFADLIPGRDLVLGYIAERRSSLVGTLLSGAERILYRLMLGPMPRFQGIFMCRRAILNEIPLRSAGRGWAVVMELLLRASRGGYRLVSVPTGYRPRMSGTSKVNNWRTASANFRQMLAMRRLL